MDINARRRRAHKVVADTPNSFYSHDVSMYPDSEAPRQAIPLSEFEDLALERLQLLRIIEQASLKGNKIFSDEWKKSIKEDLIKNNLKKYVRLINGLGGQTDSDVQVRRADHISHFILRMAYCRSEDLRRWFLTRELEWFKLRFSCLSRDAVLNFLHSNNLTYQSITPEEKELQRNNLIASTASLSDVGCDTTDFYKVPFTDALTLVKNRKVLVRKGFAYVPATEIVVCVQTEFRAALSKSLVTINHRLPQVDDDRLTDLLYNLHNTYTGKDYTFDHDSNKDAISLSCLDAYSKKHYPFCMRYVHEVLRAEHHLKHVARLQYGLFLKGIGLLYEQAVQFWREEFTKKMDENKFEKGYLYNIKHNYGLVGNRVSYSPFSCIKIITSNVGAGEHHGCPFKSWDAANLRQKIVEHGVSSEGEKVIMDLVSNGHYQIACTKYFEYTHGQPPSMVINHPNQYFEESMNLTKEKQAKKN